MANSTDQGTTDPRVIRKVVTSAIVGPRTEEQWDAYTKAQDVKISAEDEAFIDSLVTPGHASTPGFNDVSHFVSGRTALSR